MKYKVIIPTSGIGSRLGDFSQFTNKSLAPVGSVPAICRIIDSYHKDIDIVVLLGHFGEHVRELLELVYPERKITYVKVDNYSGIGSSLVYSILQAESVVDCPFILHACDTLIYKSFSPMPDCNWLGGCKITGSSQYTTFDISNGFVTKIYEKGQKDYDFVFIGIAGIFDYKDFFANARKMYDSLRSESQLSNIHVHAVQIGNGIRFECREFNDWLDVGNIDSLGDTQKYYQEPRIRSLNKKGEAIYEIDNRVVKFFADSDIATKRVIRAKLLENVVPEIKSSNRHFYSYDFVEGESLASIVTPKIMEELFRWANKYLWKNVLNDDGFREICRRFYYEKTLARIDEFCTIFNIEDVPVRINGFIVPSAKEMLFAVPIDDICSNSPVTFHGDFILDNIVYTPDGRFVLMDWRQDFGGDNLRGDIYYDLAKLNFSFIFNQEVVRDGFFKVKEKSGDVIIDIMMSFNLMDCREVFIEFMNQNRFNGRTLDIITAIVCLNMSPLHEHPLSLFLYYFGRLLLYHALRRNK